MLVDSIAEQILELFCLDSGIDVFAVIAVDWWRMTVELAGLSGHYIDYYEASLHLDSSGS